MSCDGVDVQAWKAKNRVPLFPAKMNRWVLVRTLRDNPSPERLRQTLAAAFMHWFSGTILDPLLTFDGTTRSGDADLIRLVSASQARILLSGKTVARREMLPYPPMPTVEGPAVVYLEVEFAYRGQFGEMAWPTYYGTIGSEAQQCPVKADWMLDRAYEPTAVAPEEKGPLEKVTGTAGKVLEPLLTPLVTTALVLGAGYLAITWSRNK